MLHTTDSGATWSAQLSNSAQLLGAACFLDDRHGWAAGEGGAIYTTADGGEKWSPQIEGFQGMLTSIDFIDGRRGWTVVSMKDDFRTVVPPPRK